MCKSGFGAPPKKMNWTVAAFVVCLRGRHIKNRKGLYSMYRTHETEIVLKGEVSAE